MRRSIPKAVIKNSIPSTPESVAGTHSPPPPRKLIKISFGSSHHQIELDLGIISYVFVWTSGTELSWRRKNYCRAYGNESLWKRGSGPSSQTWTTHKFTCCLLDNGPWITYLHSLKLLFIWTSETVLQISPPEPLSNTRFRPSDAVHNKTLLFVNLSTLWPPPARLAFIMSINLSARFDRGGIRNYSIIDLRGDEE